MKFRQMVHKKKKKTPRLLRHGERGIRIYPGKSGYQPGFDVHICVYMALVCVKSMEKNSISNPIWFDFFLLFYQTRAGGLSEYVLTYKYIILFIVYTRGSSLAYAHFSDVTLGLWCESEKNQTERDDVARLIAIRVRQTFEWLHTVLL